MRLKVYLYVIFAVLVGFMVVSHLVPASAEGPADWVAEFPLTDFSIRSIDFGEIDFDGARRDTITPVGIPVVFEFIQVSDTETAVGVFEPVLSVVIDGDARAYPLAILLWHEIVNDVVGGVPILVSYCPLCNSGVVFDRRLESTARFWNSATPGGCETSTWSCTTRPPKVGGSSSWARP